MQAEQADSRKNKQPFSRKGRANVRRGRRSGDVHALKSLINETSIDANLAIKVVLLATSPACRPVVDALTTSDLSRLGEVEDRIIELLNSIRADTAAL